VTAQERFLSKRQRYQPISLPQHFSDEEVARDWTLLERDRQEIERALITVSAILGAPRWTQRRTRKHFPPKTSPAVPSSGARVVH
jgi:hypothetical protein